jgi:hypothetical protein
MTAQLTLPESMSPRERACEGIPLTRNHLNAITLSCHLVRKIRFTVRDCCNSVEPS